MEIQSIFKRKEMKYAISINQYNAFRKKIADMMIEDSYGLHTISSIYFDNWQDDIIRTSMRKPLYKEKLRLRSYGTPKNDDSQVFLELKKKFKGTVYKRRIPMGMKEAEKYIAEGSFDRPSQIFNEIDYFKKHYNAYPKVMIAYDRIAMFGAEDSNLRLTFDFNVRYRRENLSLRAGEYGTKILPDGIILMEIKISNAMPLWLSDILGELKIYPTSFSKYGEIYSQEIKKSKGEIVICSQVS